MVERLLERASRLEAHLLEAQREVRAIRRAAETRAWQAQGVAAKEGRALLTEREILGSLGDGLTTLQIAERLSISPRTVESHVEHISEELEIHSRTALVARYLRQEP
jgi:non-specific serine/threonine protein kinase